MSSRVQGWPRDREDAIAVGMVRRVPVRWAAVAALLGLSCGGEADEGHGVSTASPDAGPSSVENSDDEGPDSSADGGDGVGMAPLGGCLADPSSCDDGLACTEDLCLHDGQCHHPPRVCPPGNGYCEQARCEEPQGCSVAPTLCDDGVACTEDTCEPETGCVHSPRADACSGGGPCVDAVCNPALGCELVERAGPCDDGDACTQDSQCVDGQCAGGMPLDCNDGDVCTVDLCAPSVGCVRLSAECDDGDICTTGHCAPGLGCVHTAVQCPGDACVVPSCEPVVGCVATPVQCPEGDACLPVHCDPSEGCVSAPLLCDDANACTIDACDPKDGCVHEAVSCVDGDVCTEDTCDPELGCTHAPVFSCHDGDECTLDLCHPLLGCVHYPDPCLPPSTCQVYTGCHVEQGCQFAPVYCDDGDACTLSGCDEALGCVSLPLVDCDDGDPLTLDTCDPQLGCVHGPPGPVLCGLSAAAGDEVTCPIQLAVDTSPGALPAAAMQLTLHFDPQRVQAVQVETTGPLFPGGPVATLAAPPSPLLTTGHAVHIDGGYEAWNLDGRGSVLFVNAASPNTPLSTAEWNEGDILGDPVVAHIRFTVLSVPPTGEPAFVYTSDFVLSNTEANGMRARVEAGVIIASDPCTSHSDCDDGDPCTSDNCIVGVCYHAPLSLGADPCVIKGCDPITGVYEQPVDCDDGNVCTVDICDTIEGACLHVPVDIDDGDGCTADFCDPHAGVFHVPADCDDGNACTTAECDPSVGCINLPHGCDDGIACTVDACQNKKCTHTPDHGFCNDGDPTTEDACFPSALEADELGCVNL